MTQTVAKTSRLYSFALAALAKLLPPSDHSPEAEFLRSHESSTASKDGPAADFSRQLADPARGDLPLLQLARDLGLNQVELLVTALAAAVEMDLMCGRAVAHLQIPLGGSRPTLGLLATALRELSAATTPTLDSGETGNILAAIFTGSAVQAGLLRIGNENAPLVERPISVPVPLCLVFHEENIETFDASWPGANLAAQGTGEIPLAPSVLERARKQALALSAGQQRTLAIRSGSPAESRAVAAEIARRLNSRALFIDVEKLKTPPAVQALTPWLFLRKLVPVFCFELGPGERQALPVLPFYRGPQLAVCGPEGSLEADGNTVPGWTLGVASREERLGLWTAAIGEGSLAAEMSSHRHGSGRIAQLGRLSRFQSALDGRPEPAIQDVVSSSWTAEGDGLESLAQPLPDKIPDDALVMTPTLRDELNRLLLRCRWREGLADGLGASALAKYLPGVRALFTGPSGTGKTLAAGWLATRLGLPIYRVDLAAVTSKYIGETEKNLAQLLARAEHAEVILLFDEADSMFGKRTDIKESNDRFANAQTNYLLQRIESFDGIVFLTSNNRSRFDPAFFRRLDTIIEFPVPGPMERRSLWQSHLGAGHELSQRELNQLSAAADLLGGNIRNAVLTASLLSRSEDRPICYRDIVQSLGDEYRKLGRQLPSALQDGWNGNSGPRSIED